MQFWRKHKKKKGKKCKKKARRIQKIDKIATWLIGYAVMICIALKSPLPSLLCYFKLQLLTDSYSALRTSAANVRKNFITYRIRAKESKE